MMQVNEQLIVNTFHYSENNNYRLPYRNNSLGYENNHFKVKKKYVDSIEQNSVLSKLRSKCFESVVIL